MARKRGSVKVYDDDNVGVVFYNISQRMQYTAGAGG